MDEVSVAADTPVEMRRRLKSIFGGSVGNLIEWYDFYVYNAFALYFAKFFFPGSDPTAQFLSIFGIYAIGFFIRPVGGWILGVYADRAGRRLAPRSGLATTVPTSCGPRPPHAAGQPQDPLGDLPGRR